MYCSYCGKEIPEDALFCPYCGKTNPANRQNTNPNQNQNANTISRPAGQKLNKVFSFGTFCSNDEAICEINAWLKGQRIIISSISVITKLNASKTRSVLSRCEIIYQEVAGLTKIYQMGYFARWRWIGTNFEALDQDLDNWKSQNPEYEVVYSIQQGHQYNGGNTRTLFFLYAPRR